mgnify:CR=1 FL=1
MLLLLAVAVLFVVVVLSVCFLAVRGVRCVLVVCMSEICLVVFKLPKAIFGRWAWVERVPLAGVIAGRWSPHRSPLAFLRRLEV